MSVIKLLSSDGHEFEVPKDVACVSVLIENLLHDVTEASETIPLPMPLINAGLCSQNVIEYATYHRHDKVSRKNTAPLALMWSATASASASDSWNGPNTSAWDATFIASLDRPMLIKVMTAANYLDIQGLLELCCRSTAEVIENMSANEVKELFEITHVNTPEEEDQIRQEMLWFETRQKKRDQRESKKRRGGRLVW
ncbi:hypothetical protein HDU86_002021 [Geranomyces michiganensis]|nr:hypothetical protein HDU86_002021 [Geranomyces michiganensis]